MFNRWTAFALSALLCAAATPAQEKKEAKVPPVLQFEMKDIDGKKVDLARYKGKVILIVNVASECGYTPQYKQLQALYAKHAKDGLAVLGFPCNDFGGQEPGDEAKVKAFAYDNYKVTFDLFSKVKIAGDDACPLYKFLTAKQTNAKFAGSVQWNFEKFLIAPGGEVVNRFRPRTQPDAPEVVSAIEAVLPR